MKPRPFQVRLHPPLHARLAKVAKANGRSLNSEISFRLSCSFLSERTELERKLNELLIMIGMKP